MMVADIAYARLTPAARAAVDKLLALNIPPESATSVSRDFVHASLWADMVRKEPGFETTADLHFIDSPFSVDGTVLPSTLPRKNNVVTALTEEVKLLKERATPPAERARALRFLIHFLGDIHQPLHCATRVSILFPDGDQGGNNYNVKVSFEDGQERRTRLHAYWDEGLRSFPRAGPEHAPPSTSEIHRAVSSVLHDDPDSDRGWRVGGVYGFRQWMTESAWLARHTAYDGIKRAHDPSNAYRREGIRVVRRRIAWAGYRLAALLNAIYSVSR